MSFLDGPKSLPTFQEFGPELVRKGSNNGQSVSAAEKLLVSLNFVAEGLSLNSLRNIHGISAPACQDAVHEVLEVIFRRRKEYLKFPDGRRARQIARDFQVKIVHS